MTKTLWETWKILKNRPLINKNIFPTDKPAFESFIQGPLLTFPGFLYLYSSSLKKLSPSYHTITFCGFSSFLLISFSLQTSGWLFFYCNQGWSSHCSYRTMSSNAVFSNFFTMIRKGPFRDWSPHQRTMSHNLSARQLTTRLMVNIIYMKMKVEMYAKLKWWSRILEMMLCGTSLHWNFSFSGHWLWNYCSRSV